MNREIAERLQSSLESLEQGGPDVSPPSLPKEPDTSSADGLSDETGSSAARVVHPASDEAELQALVGVAQAIRAHRPRASTQLRLRSDDLLSRVLDSESGSDSSFEQLGADPERGPDAGVAGATKVVLGRCEAAFQAVFASIMLRMNPRLAPLWFATFVAVGLGVSLGIFAADHQRAVSEALAGNSLSSGFEPAEPSASDVAQASGVAGEQEPGRVTSEAKGQTAAGSRIALGHSRSRSTDTGRANSDDAPGASQASSRAGEGESSQSLNRNARFGQRLGDARPADVTSTQDEDFSSEEPAEAFVNDASASTNSEQPDVNGFSAKDGAKKSSTPAALVLGFDSEVALDSESQPSEGPRRAPAVGESRRVTPAPGQSGASGPGDGAGEAAGGLPGDDLGTSPVLRPWGSVSGRVVLDDGTPLGRFPVTAYVVGEDGRVQWWSRRSTSTDRRGRYRLHDLPRGNYKVMAGYAFFLAPRVWYPAVRRASEATTLAVSAGNRNDNIDMEFDRQSMLWWLWLFDPASHRP